MHIYKKNITKEVWKILTQTQTQIIYMFCLTGIYLYQENI